MPTTTPLKSVLLLSGGLDSTVAAYMAQETTEPILALSFDYGQKARRRELAAAYALASRLGVPHRTVFLPFFSHLGSSALMEPGRDLPHPGHGELDDQAHAEASAAAVWVPNRNGIFIAVGAAWAEAQGADVLVVGFNAEEARTFPDNSVEFVLAQNDALGYSTRNAVQVISPTATLDKRGIVAHAMAKDLPLEWVWSCYDGGDDPCGACESCRRFDRAVEAAGASDWLDARREKGSKS